MLDEEQNASHRRHCPNCQRRIHPLDLSDLHRGRKVECAYCHSELRAQTAGGTGSLVGTGVALLPMAQDILFAGVTTLYALLFAATVLFIIWLAPPGLIGGAPWVRIAATRPSKTGKEAYGNTESVERSET